MSAQDGIMQQIEQLLRDGKSSRQVIDMRYNPSSVYKVQRRVRAGADAPLTGGNDPTAPTARLGDEQRDPEVESHPEVVELKRELRKVQLQSQIAAIRAGRSRYTTGYNPRSKIIEGGSWTRLLLPIMSRQRAR